MGVDDPAEGADGQLRHRQPVGTAGTRLAGAWDFNKIDIRNGPPQLECINCGLCIDACDEIMDRIKRPRGLIAYDTYTNVERRAQGRGIRFTLLRVRPLIYAGLMVVVGAIMLFGLTSIGHHFRWSDGGGFSGAAGDGFEWHYQRSLAVDPRNPHVRWVAGRWGQSTVQRTGDDGASWQALDVVTLRDIRAPVDHGCAMRIEPV